MYEAKEVRISGFRAFRVEIVSLLSIEDKRVYKYACMHDVTSFDSGVNRGVRLQNNTHCSSL